MSGCRVAIVVEFNGRNVAVPIQRGVPAEYLRQSKRSDYRDGIHENLNRIAIDDAASCFYEIADIVAVVAF